MLVTNIFNRHLLSVFTGLVFLLSVPDNSHAQCYEYYCDTRDEARDYVEGWRTAELPFVYCGLFLQDYPDIRLIELCNDVPVFSNGTYVCTADHACSGGMGYGYCQDPTDTCCNDTNQSCGKPDPCSGK